MSGSMEVFLGALIQITTTTIVLLISGMIAFSVYQKQRRITYTDEILHEKIKISQSINELYDLWVRYFGAGIVPPGFEIEYKKLFNENNTIGIWKSGLLGIAFEENDNSDIYPHIRKALKEADPDFLKRDSWGYPVRLFFISKLMEALSRRSILRTSTNPEGIFPINPANIGFSEWKDDFAEIYKQNPFIERLVKDNEKSELIEGLKMFHSQDHQNFIDRYATAALSCVKEYLETTKNIQRSINYIEHKQYVIENNFLNLKNTNWIIFFTAVSFICGIVIPMLLISNKANMSSLIGNGIFALTLVSLIFSFLIFFKNAVSSEEKTNDQRYIKSYVYKPFMNALSVDKKQIANYDQIDLSFIYDFKAKLVDIPEGDLAMVKKYIKIVEKYNDDTMSFWRQIKEKSTLKYSFIKEPPFDTAHSSIDKTIWFNKLKRDEILADGYENKKVLGMSGSTSVWSRSLIYLCFDKYDGKLEEIIDGFDSLATDIIEELYKIEYFKIRSELEKINGELLANSTQW